MPNPIREAATVSRWILTHPSNRDRRWKQYRHAVAYQLRGRLLKQPTITRLGSHSKIYAELHDHTAAWCVYANPPDHDEMTFWAARLQPGDLFIDVGANSGMYTLWALDLGCEVIAVEPDEGARRRLERNLQLNGYKAEIVAAAVADKPGTMRFTRARDATNRIATATDTNTYDVPVTTLDEILQGRFAAGVKIDVEGAERLVILGASDALSDRRIGALQLEWNHASIELLGETRDPLKRALEEVGYSLQYPFEKPTTLPMSDRDVFALAGP
jgi:FkbM family methyltransferase